ncbi:uncharacterized protein LOC108711600 [Xenopus laevis]|uniref:Uncharacterized protein LOC108711600 n=1 Tax=Xenopus laevis TaxID=8355 RepID=A0A8J1LZU2_XENLA|nr:uncharacterized protein LOC108711600 [Xenopus laevis]
MRLLTFASCVVLCLLRCASLAFEVTDHPNVQSHLRSVASLLRRRSSTLRPQTSSLSCQTSSIRNQSSSIRHPPSGIRNPPSGVLHQESFIRRPPSGILHQASGVRNPPSGVRIRHQASASGIRRQDQIIHETSDMEREEIIRGLFCNGHTQKEIIWILDKVYSYRISDRHLRRILKSYSLCRRALNRDHQSIFNAVKNEIQICSPMIGVKAMHRKIRDLKGIRPCYRNDVYQVMRVLDPYGLQFRRPGQCRIPRIVYSCRGPNDVWHIDGNDKLKFYGIWIHLCIDGFSRRVIWLNAGTTNRKPDIIGRYFLNAVDSANGCPRLVRSDRGIENVLVAIFQTSFRYYHNDSCSGSKSFRFGKSVHNQRAECFFGHLKKSWISMWQQNFELTSAVPSQPGFCHPPSNACRRRNAHAYLCPSGQPEAVCVCRRAHAAFAGGGTNPLSLGNATKTLSPVLFSSSN